MSIEVSLLSKEFRTRLLDLIAACKARGVTMAPFLTLRTPQEQASLWRQGRTAADAELKALALQNAKAPFLANCLRENVPRETNLVTDVLPGYCWHQWGEACDCVWVDKGNRVNWHVKQLVCGVNGYQVFVEEINKAGLTSGSAFEKPDWPHVQLQKDKPIDLGLPLIESEMKKRFDR